MLFAGARQFQVTGAGESVHFGALLHYPCEEPARPTRFGPYELDVSVDAPPAPGRFPLALISHGGGGSPLLYRTLSLLLARNGFFVALPKHPGNSLGDNGRAETVENLRDRPAHLVALIDALQADATVAPSLADEPVTAIGHSMGGYTVLCVAGGQPWSRARETIPVAHDNRVGTVVLMAPLCDPFLAPAALAGVNAPILALTAEHDLLTPDSVIRKALDGVADPRRVRIDTIPNAGHFSFLAPFPQTLSDPNFAPAQDPSGFDRRRFHELFPGMILEWIRERRTER